MSKWVEDYEAQARAEGVSLPHQSGANGFSSGVDDLARQTSSLSFSGSTFGGNTRSEQNDLDWGQGRGGGHRFNNNFDAGNYGGSSRGGFSSGMAPRGGGGGYRGRGRGGRGAGGFDNPSFGGGYQPRDQFGSGARDSGFNNDSSSFSGRDFGRSSEKPSSSTFGESSWNFGSSNEGAALNDNFGKSATPSLANDNAGGADDDDDFLPSGFGSSFSSSALNVTVNKSVSEITTTTAFASAFGNGGSGDCDASGASAFGMQQRGRGRGASFPPRGFGDGRGYSRGGSYGRGRGGGFGSSGDNGDVSINVPRSYSSRPFGDNNQNSGGYEQRSSWNNNGEQKRGSNWDSDGGSQTYSSSNRGGGYFPRGRGGENFAPRGRGSFSSQRGGGFSSAYQTQRTWDSGESMSVDANATKQPGASFNVPNSSDPSQRQTRQRATDSWGSDPNASDSDFGGGFNAARKDAQSSSNDFGNAVVPARYASRGGDSIRRPMRARGRGGGDFFGGRGGRGGGSWGAGADSGASGFGRDGDMNSGFSFRGRPQYGSDVDYQPRGRGRGRGTFFPNISKRFDTTARPLGGHTMLPDRSKNETDPIENPMSPEDIALLNKFIHKTVKHMREGTVDIRNQQQDPNSPLHSLVNFRELRIKDDLLRALDLMGFQQPSKIQEFALPLLLMEPPTNMIAQSQSGTGKTAAFVLTMLSRVVVEDKFPQCVCLAPTFELAKQIGEVVGKMAKFMPDVKVHYAVKGNQLMRGSQVEEQIVIGTPGKLVDYMTKFQAFDASRVKCVVLDEADVMISQQGHKDLSIRIYNQVQVANPSVQALLFSATYDDEVIKFAEQLIKNAVMVTLRKEEQALPNIKQYYVECANRDAKYDAVVNLYSGLTIASAIIFCHTIQSARWLANKMSDKGHEVALLHGQLSVEERAMAIQQFKDGQFKVLITTNVCARGIDVSQVSIVINYDPPIRMISPDREPEPDYETYLHRIGRTGRFGKAGIAINFVDSKQSLELIHRIQEYFQKPIIKLDPADIEQLEAIEKDDD